MAKSLLQFVKRDGLLSAMADSPAVREMVRRFIPADSPTELLPLVTDLLIASEAGRAVVDERGDELDLWLLEPLAYSKSNEHAWAPGSIWLGPTTLLATLSSLQMGFRTLALEKRSAEVWEVLGAVKTEFNKFGEFVAKVRGQAENVVKTLDQAQTRTNMMNRALKKVEALPDEQAGKLLPPEVGAAAEAGTGEDESLPAERRLL